MPNEKGPSYSQMIANLASAMMPTPVKAFARQFSGTKDPLTEDFFKPKEISALAKLISQSKFKLQSPSKNTTSSEWAAMVGKQPGIVDYGDYADMEQRPGAQLLEALLPTSATLDVPLESLRHTLGNFAYKEVVDPITGEIQYKVTDEYNWDPVYGDYGLADTTGMKRGEGRYPEWKDLANIIAGRVEPAAKIGERSKDKYTASQRLSNLIEWAGAKFGPRSSEGEGMRFDITVPTGKYKDLAEVIASGTPEQRRATQEDERQFYEEHPQDTLELTATEWTSPFGMPIYVDQHGEKHSESSTTIQLDPTDPNSKWVTVPSIWPDPETGKGRYGWSDDQIRDKILKNNLANPISGEQIQTFDTSDQAVQYAIDRDLMLRDPKHPWNQQ